MGQLLVKPSIGDVVILNFKAHNQITAGPSSFEGPVVSAGNKSIKCHPKETFTQARIETFAERENPFSTIKKAVKATT